MTKIKFRNNDEMPAFGLGTWKSEEGKVYNAIKTAIKIGYRHIDCAHIYGNEKEVGQALSDCFSEMDISRKDLWITSKLWNNSHAYKDVFPALKQTLKDLQLEYLDLYLIHWPVTLKRDVTFPTSAEDFLSLDEVPLAKTWEAMEEAVYAGLTKHIGVSNFGIKKLEDLISKSEITPEINQVELHPYLQQEDLVSFCKSNSIKLTAYAPLGSADRPDALKSQNEPTLLDNPTITEIAKSKNATPAQILISWGLHKGFAVIPKSTNPDRIKQNYDAQYITLTKDDMEEISKLDKEFRYVDGSIWIYKNGHFSSLEELWA